MLVSSSRIIRTEYQRPHLTNLTYVIMFNNLKFNDELKSLKLEPDIEEAQKVFTEQHGFKLQNIENYKNLSLKETEEKIENLKTTDFTTYSSLVIIYSSHGKSDGELFTSDKKTFMVSDFWDACKQNTSLIHKPIIIIIDACRGPKADKYTRDNKSDTFHRFHPEKYHFLIVYATTDGFVARVNNGSYFLSKYLEILKSHLSWDILAQITQATHDVLERAKQTSRTQTVTYISLLPMQFRFSGEELHEWNDVNQYSHGKTVAVVFKRDHFFSANEKTEITNAINDAGFQIITEEQGTTAKFPADIRAAIIFARGYETDHDVHEDFVPELQREYSFDNMDQLKGVPKVFFFLGLKKSHDVTKTKGGCCSSEKKDDETKYSIISENSDCLFYCDNATGWCKAICDVIRKSPGNPIGLVRLLTDAMSRLEVLKLERQPHIQSTLRKMLVMPSKTE